MEPAKELRLEVGLNLPHPSPSTIPSDTVNSTSAMDGVTYTFASSHVLPRDTNHASELVRSDPMASSVASSSSAPKNTRLQQADNIRNECSGYIPTTQNHFTTPAFSDSQPLPTFSCALTGDCPDEILANWKTVKQLPYDIFKLMRSFYPCPEASNTPNCQYLMNQHSQFEIGTFLTLILLRNRIDEQVWSNVQFYYGWILKEMKDRYNELYDAALEWQDDRWQDDSVVSPEIDIHHDLNLLIKLRQLTLHLGSGLEEILDKSQRIENVEAWDPDVYNCHNAFGDLMDELTDLWDEEKQEYANPPKGFYERYEKWEAEVLAHVHRILKGFCDLKLKYEFLAEAGELDTESDDSSDEDSVEDSST